MKQENSLSPEFSMNWFFSTISIWAWGLCFPLPSVGSFSPGSFFFPYLHLLYCAHIQWLPEKENKGDWIFWDLGKSFFSPNINHIDYSSFVGNFALLIFPLWKHIESSLHFQCSKVFPRCARYSVCLFILKSLILLFWEILLNYFFDNLFLPCFFCSDFMVLLHYMLGLLNWTSNFLTFQPNEGFLLLFISATSTISVL